MDANNGGYHRLKQYMRANPIKHGIKLWALCCFVTKYVLKFEVYVGVSEELPLQPGEVNLGLGYGVVSRLLAKLDH